LKRRIEPARSKNVWRRSANAQRSIALKLPTENGTISSPDEIVDMIFMLYRNAGLDSSQYLPLVFPGTAWLGMYQDFFVDDGSRRIRMTWPGSGTTSVMNAANDGGTLNRPNYRVQVHELAHFFFGDNDWHNGGGFWAMLGGGRRNSQNQDCANSLERELVGWIAPDSIYQNTSNVTLTDFVVTGDAVKIKLPGSNPNEYFRLEYHTRTSLFDSPERWDPSAKGLYILHQTGLGYPAQGFMRLRAADGRWYWTSDTVVHPSYYPSGLAVFKRSRVDRMDGADDSYAAPWTWIGPPPAPGPGISNPALIIWERDRATNQVRETLPIDGDGGDAFSLAKNPLFSPWSMTNSQNQTKQKTWVTVEIVNEIQEPIPTLVMNIYFDSLHAASAAPSKPPLGWDPRDLGKPYQLGWVYLAWGADIWDGQPIEPDINWSELQRKIGTDPWATVYSGPSRVWENGSIYYDPNGATPVYFRVRLRDSQNKWSAWSDIYNTKERGITSQEKVAPGSIPEERPLFFALSQNYPNPFNPTTTIAFALPEPSHVSLVVYDVLGRKVAELENGMKEAGYHSATWNASEAASGVYFARFFAMDAGGNMKLSKVNKLLLAK
jgi:hypothetical protein